MNNLHHDHVHTDEYTQTGATLQYYNIQIYVATATSQPVKQKPGVKETRQGATLPKQVSGNLEWDNMLIHWRWPKESLSYICPIRTWCGGKIKDATSPSQPVGA